MEEAIQGTSYVNEIYERVQKAATDLNFEGQVSKHYEYQSQLDQMKQDLIAAQKQRDMLLSDNEKLTLDIGILSKDVIKKRAPEQPQKMEIDSQVNRPQVQNN